jgi:hypothetical protein
MAVSALGQELMDILDKGGEWTIRIKKIKEG